MKRIALAGFAALAVSGCSVVGQPENETILRVAVNASSMPFVMEALNEYEAATPGVYFTTVESNSSMALTALQSGEVDFALLFSPADTGAPFQVSVGAEALALVVHPDNPVSGLTMAQARSVFSGRTANWEALGGADSSIHVVVREDDSDARRVFQALVLGGESPASAAQVATSSAQVLDIIENDPQAIGYVALGALDGRARVLSLNRVTPTPETIRTGDYPLVGQIVFAAQAEPEGGGGDFLSWLVARN